MAKEWMILGGDGGRRKPGPELWVSGTNWTKEQKTGMKIKEVRQCLGPFENRSQIQMEGETVLVGRVGVGLGERSGEGRYRFIVIDGLSCREGRSVCCCKYVSGDDDFLRSG